MVTMKLRVCLVCLNTFDGEDHDLASDKKDGLEGISSSIPLFNRFLKFAENYLQVSRVTTEQLMLDGGGKEAFCGRCKVSLINPICQVYLELLSSQLRLSSELEQLGNLLDNSKLCVSETLRDLNLNTLSSQLGIPSLPQLEGFRTSLAQKCHLKRKQALPSVLLTSRDVKEHISTMETDESSFTHNLEQDKVEEVNPLAAVETTEHNVVDLEAENLSSVGRENGEEETRSVGGIPVGSIVIRFETLRPDSKQEGVTEIGVVPAAECKGTHIDGVYYNVHKCPKCSKELIDGYKYESHYRWSHLAHRCNSCGKTLATKSSAQTHFNKYHVDVGEHRCQLCSKVYKTPEKLRYHIRGVHNMVHLPCTHCDATFTKKVSLKQHIRAVHQPARFTCPHCPEPQVFPINKYLRAHIKKHHPEFFGVGQPPQNNLSSVGGQSGGEQAIAKISVGTVGVNCIQPLPNGLVSSQCVEVQAQPGGMETHELPYTLARDVTDNNSFVLQQKDQSTSGINGDIARAPIGPVTKLRMKKNEKLEELLSSALTEVGVIPVGEEALTSINGTLYNGTRCPSCSKVLKDVNQYQIHYRWYHLPFKCNSCGKTFKDQNSARFHFKHIHHGGGTGGRHGCVFCGKVFDAEYKLKNHIHRVHPIKRVPCPHCDADFKLRSNLEHHIRAVHQPGEFTCPHCTQSTPMVFATKRYLRAHIRRQHPEIYCLEMDPVDTSPQSSN